jgi:hypothetical protein
MYKSNSGFREISNRFFVLIRYLAIRKEGAFFEVFKERMQEEYRNDVANEIPYSGS